MKNLAFIVTLLTLTSCNALSSLSDEHANRRVTVMYGQQEFDDDAVDDDVRADQYGVQYEYRSPEALGGVVSEIGFLYGKTDTTATVGLPGGGLASFDASLDTYELFAGIRKDFPIGRFVPSIGAGLDAMGAEAHAGGGSDSDFNLGGYAKVGVRFDITENLAIGLEGRYRAMPDFSVGDVSGDLSGASALLTLSYGF